MVSYPELGAALARIEERLDGLIARVDEQLRQFEKMDSRIREVESEYVSRRSAWSLVGLFVTVLGGLSAAVFELFRKG